MGEGTELRVLALRACVIGFFGYIEFMGARVPACACVRVYAREARIVERAPITLAPRTQKEP